MKKEKLSQITKNDKKNEFNIYIQMKKRYCYAFISLTLIACTDNEKDTVSVRQNVLDSIPLESPMIENEKEIVGKWTMFASEYENVTTRYNVMRVVDFNNDKTVQVHMPSGDIEKYKWLINEDSILIINADYKKQPVTFDSVYIMNFHSQEGRVELNLKQAKKKYTFFLRKKE